MLYLLPDQPNLKTSDDLKWLFVKALECRNQHWGRVPKLDAMDFCDSCKMDVEQTFITRQMANHEAWFVLDERDICALMRQTFTTHISQEGTSGPLLHALLGRITRHIGMPRYREYIGKGWPERLR